MSKDLNKLHQDEFNNKEGEFNQVQKGGEIKSNNKNVRRCRICGRSTLNKSGLCLSHEQS